MLPAAVISYCFRIQTLCFFNVFFFIGKTKKGNLKSQRKTNTTAQKWDFLFLTAALFAGWPLLFSLFLIFKTWFHICAYAHASTHFVRRHNTDACSTNNNKLPSVVVQQSQTVVRCVLTVEKTWLTAFVGTINCAVIWFYYRIEGFWL